MSSIKYALFDVDGVVLMPRKQYFSQLLAAEKSIPPESVQEFFAGVFRQKCIYGKADLKEEVAPYLSSWKWEGSVDDLLRFWFESESTTNADVLAEVQRLRAAGVACYLATRQEKYRMSYLWNEVGLKDHFDGYFVTAEIGVDKSDPAFFAHVFSTLGASPEEILYFDDLEKNIEVAKSLGISAYFFTGPEVLSREVDAIC